ncbi:MAG TPA: ribonuclease P protein component [Devosia sp.]
MTAIEQPSTLLRRLTKRSQFQRAARGNRTGRSAFGLQAVPAPQADAGVGFTVTKKTGNSPQRSRIKRRLRAAVTACADDFTPAHDYVLIGKREALSEPFSKLVADLGSALVRVHAPRSPNEQKSSGRGPRKPKQ